MVFCHENTRLWWARGALLVCGVGIAAAQGAPAALPTHMDFQQTSYELRKGEPVLLSAPSDTLNFLYTAKDRTITAGGAPVAGLVVGANRSGDIVLAASLRAKPGKYNVTVSATSPTGEVRQAAMNITVDELTPVPAGSSRPPVVFLNGWQTGVSGACPIATSNTQDFGNLASYLVSDGVPVVYLFDNCLEDAFQSVETLGNDLGDFLNSIQYTDGTQVPQIDLVGFSLGGLIVRSYLAGLQPNGVLEAPVPTLVRKVVFIATPNFGSFVAGNYTQAIQTNSQVAELIPGSALLWNLATWNQHFDDLRGVSAIAVVGDAGSYEANLTSGVVSNNASDGLVSETSAALGFAYPQSSFAASTRVVPYCHVDPGVFTNTVFGSYQCNAAGIANVTTTGHLTGQIVRSFLAGNNNWQSIGAARSADPYLASSGGMFFALLNSAGAYVADLSQVNWGSVGLQNGGDPGTIFYYDFLKGTGTLTATSSSQGTVNCGSVGPLPAGYFNTVRCKEGPTIISIGPLLTTAAGLVVAGGSSIKINGNSFGSSCSGCKVVATPGGSSTGTVLQVSSWANTAISATLPSTLTGPVTITVNASSGNDSMATIVGAANAGTIAVSPASLSFSYTTGGTTPPQQSVQITNTGGGSLAWTATATVPWLSVSPASGAAPSTLAINILPEKLSAGGGTFNGAVQISSPGATNTPQSVAVALTVTVPTPVLSVSPASLTFSFTNGGSAPPPQTVSIAFTGAALPWTASSSVYWLAVSPSSGAAPASLSVSLNPANLAAGTYNGAVQVSADGAQGSPASIAVTLTVQGTLPAPAITSIANAGSILPGAASATWLAIFGSNLSTTTYSWQGSDFVNGQLPTSVQGVSVVIDGKPGYISYLSPTQINVLAPDDPNTGSVPVQVTTAGQGSNVLTFTKSQFAPAFFTFDGKHVAAQTLTYIDVGPPGLIPGVTFQPAQPGETIVLYANGFGPTDPPLPTGQLVTASSPLPNNPQVTIGGLPATVSYAGLVGPGLYQLNVIVPSVPNGDAALLATIGGASTQTGVLVTVQQ